MRTLLALALACGPAPSAAPPAGAPAAAPAAASSPVSAAAGPQPPLPTVSLLVAGEVVMAEVADDPEERALGLMGRRALEPGQGMLFVYPDEAPRSFWMKNTLLPLSIAYLDAEGAVVAIRDMAPHDERGVPSGRPARYALEVPQGWFGAVGLAEGQRVEGLPGPSSR
jgi:uncharacterized membrane protein (UPF0127 family)